MGLAVVRDLRDEARVPAGPEELADFETDMLAGFVLAQATAGLADGTIRFTSLASSAWTTRPPSATPTPPGTCWSRPQSNTLPPVQREPKDPTHGPGPDRHRSAPTPSLGPRDAPTNAETSGTGQMGRQHVGRVTVEV